jgi:hypothetical protein
MPRAGLIPIVSIIEHATRTVGALDFNRKALLAPGRTGPSRSVGSTSSGRTRKIQCTNIAHVRLNPSLRPEDIVAADSNYSMQFDVDTGKPSVN